MSQAHIRLARTPEVDSVLAFLRGRYPLLSEAEIIKMVLSEKYLEKVGETKDNIIDLELSTSKKDIIRKLRAPRKQSGLLSLSGVFKGPKDLSMNKKKYTYVSQ